MRAVAIILVSALCVALFRCTADKPIAGTGSQAGNGKISCVIKTTQGAAAVGAAVIARPIGYLANIANGLPKSTLSSRTATTDDSGRFEVDSLDYGTYRIEVNDGSASAVLLEATLSEDTIDVDLVVDTLLPYAIISGTIDSLKFPEFVLIYGLERIARVDSSGRFTIADLPQGVLDLRIASADTSKAPVEIRNVQTTAGATTQLPIQTLDWQYLQRLTLTTTRSGADVAENVPGFPVLLRLSAPAFDFSQALDSGQDIRFTKEDGTPLPYEIERWDRSSAQAAIWVLIDTVYGNSSTQTFVMQWGNASAASRSNAAAVFDTANGFAGVWHLGERGDGSQGEYIDATVDGNNGTSQGTSAPSAADGIAGLSQHLDNSYIEVSDNPTLEPPANMSLQAWVRLDSISSVEGKDFFVAEQFDQHLQWNSYYLRVFSAFQTVQFVWRSTDTTVLDAIGSTKLTAGTWYHLGVVKVDTLISVFVNGIDETAYRSKANSAFYISSKRSFSIGSENNLGDPGGTIDELQVSRVARSAAWMKLAFENQRQPGTLVRFGQ